MVSVKMEVNGHVIERERCTVGSKPDGGEVTHSHAKSQTK